MVVNWLGMWQAFGCACNAKLILPAISRPISAFAHVKVCTQANAESGLSGELNLGHYGVTQSNSFESVKVGGNSAELVTPFAKLQVPYKVGGPPLACGMQCGVKHSDVCCQGSNAREDVQPERHALLPGKKCQHLHSIAIEAYNPEQMRLPCMRQPGLQQVMMSMNHAGIHQHGPELPAASRAAAEPGKGVPGAEQWRAYSGSHDSANGALGQLPCPGCALSRAG